MVDTAQIRVRPKPLAIGVSLSETGSVKQQGPGPYSSPGALKVLCQPLRADGSQVLLAAMSHGSPPCKAKRRQDGEGYEDHGAPPIRSRARRPCRCCSVHDTASNGPSRTFACVTVSAGGPYLTSASSLSELLRRCCLGRRRAGLDLPWCRRRRCRRAPVEADRPALRSVVTKPPTEGILFTRPGSAVTLRSSARLTLVHLGTERAARVRVYY